MSIYARAFACLRHDPLGSLAFLACAYLLGEMPLPGMAQDLLVTLLEANLAQAALGQMLWGRRMRVGRITLRMVAALTLVILPPFMVTASVTAALGEMEAITKGLLILAVLVVSLLGWMALTGTALLSAACGLPLNLRRTLSEAPIAAWPTVKALTLGPVLGGIGALVLLGVVTGLSDALLPEGLWQDLALNLTMDGIAVFLPVLAMSAMISAWEKGHAPPSRAEVFA